MKRFVSIVLGGILSIVVQFNTSAQCAMCRASVENNVSNGDTTIGAGLNNGILYLFIMPYLMAMVIGFFWYRSAKRKKARLSMP